MIFDILYVFLTQIFFLYQKSLKGTFQTSYFEVKKLVRNVRSRGIQNQLSIRFGTALSLIKKYHLHSSLLF